MISDFAGYERTYLPITSLYYGQARQCCSHYKLFRILSMSIPTSSYCSSMLLEVVLSICLYYIMSYYPSLPRLTMEKLLGNREVQLVGVITLTELEVIVKENGKAFALFMMDLLTSYKVQKVVLHILLSANMDMGESNFT